MPNLSLTPALIVYQTKLQDHPLTLFDLNNRNEGSVRYLEDKCKEIVGYKWGNTHVFLQIISGGKLFTFHVSRAPYMGKGEYWAINVWNETGNEAIYSVQFPVVNAEEDLIPKETYYQLIESCEEHARGNIHCNDCGTLIKRSEAGGSYFAGVYCKHCWETKWKAIEAKETYN